jgi:hypothetical protein
LALCDYGYTWTFLPTSRINTNKEVKKIDQINGTGCLVLHLVEQLPFKLKAFNIFMDNYFSSIPLFQHLRLMRIGACGTCRTNSAKFPKVLKVGKETKLDWDTRSGVVVDDVLATLWIDNGAVTMLSTIHELIGDDWEVKRNRRRPRETHVNAINVCATWGSASRKLLKIPRIIDDYNHHMGGVDIADQQCGYYSTQLTTHRNWMPLFFWLLDTVIVNSYLLCKAAGLVMAHNDFRLQLVSNYIGLALIVISIKLDI